MLLSLICTSMAEFFSRSDLAVMAGVFLFFGVSWVFSWVQAVWDGWDYDAIYWEHWECEI